MRTLSTDPITPPANLTPKKILVTWLPLVASWLLMSFELPTINAIVARLPNAKVNLAAYGGVVFKSREHSQRLHNSAKLLGFSLP